MYFGGGATTCVVIHTGFRIATDWHMMVSLCRHAASVLHRTAGIEGEGTATRLASTDSAIAAYGDSVAHTAAVGIASAGGYIAFQSRHFQRHLAQKIYSRKPAGLFSMRGPFQIIHLIVLFLCIGYTTVYQEHCREK